MLIRLTGADALLLDSTTVVTDHDLLIDEGTVIAVEPTQAPVPREAEQVLTVDGGWIIPGLIDAHSHLTLHTQAPEADVLHPATPFLSAQAAQQTLAGGVTTCRDLGGHQNVDIELRNAIERGDVPGPRVLAAGKPIGATGGHIHYFCRPVDGPYEARKAVREQIMAGADVIKIMLTGGSANVDERPETMQLRQDEFDAAVTEAQAANVPVAVHAHSPAAVIQAVRAGVTSIEHAALLNEEAIEALLDSDTVLVPTQAVYRRIGENTDGWDVRIAQNAARLYQSKINSLAQAIQAGVTVGVGTDSGRHFPHGQVLPEMKALTEAGLDNTAALHAATATNAALLGLTGTVGVLHPGAAADLLLATGDPRDDLDHLYSPSLILARGKQVYTEPDPRATYRPGSDGGSQHTQG